VDSLPAFKQGFGAATLNGKIYVVGGTDKTGVLDAQIEIYDPGTNTWTAGSAMHTPRTRAAVVALNGFIYAIGGEASGMVLRSAELYNPATDTWSSFFPLDTARTDAAAVVVNNTIFVMGGNDSAQNALDSVERYSFNVPPIFQRWAYSAPMPLALSNFAAVTLGNNIYEIGGWDSSSLPRNDVNVYDVSTDSWTPARAMPITMEFLSAAELGGKIYAMGGAPAGGKPWPRVYVFDPLSTFWSTVSPMLTTRILFASLQLNGLIYAIGGDIPRSGSVEIYIPATTWYAFIKN
jgi:N-acetylneuraminic acid mutarotase